MSRLRDLLTHVVCGMQARERGASLIEYALLVGLIAVVCVAAVTYFGAETGAALDDTATAVRDSAGGG